MLVINVRNVHEALPEAVHQMIVAGVEEDTRNGPVLRYPCPVTTVYHNPRERVLFWPERDANPFFHFYESLWMLNGDNTVAPLTRFVKRMATFSDDGNIFHGAYGHRWRKHFGFDQLPIIANRLKHGHGDRRQILAMWDPRTDLHQQEGMRDIPCNLDACFSIANGALDMTVVNRSNDIVWGCYGANAVHFSMLQEVMAAMVGVPVGMYWQVSNNWHAYKDIFEKVKPLADFARQPTGAIELKVMSNPYNFEDITPFKVVNTPPDIWFSDLDMFMEADCRATGYRDVFFRKVAVPLVRAHDLYRSLDKPDCYTAAIAACQDIMATDWRMACEQWLHRRWTRWQGRK